ncbi:hypothetical protein HPB47_023593, partial [Ixodes persulcatus]
PRTRRSLFFISLRAPISWRGGSELYRGTKVATLHFVQGMCLCVRGTSTPQISSELMSSSSTGRR